MDWRRYLLSHLPPRNRRGVAVQPEQFRDWSAKWTDRFTWRDGTWVVCDCQCSMAVRHQMEAGIVGRAADCVRARDNISARVAGRDAPEDRTGVLMRCAWDRWLDRLYRIGVEEIGYRHPHKYLSSATTNTTTRLWSATNSDEALVPRGFCEH